MFPFNHHLGNTVYVTSFSKHIKHIYKYKWILASFYFVETISHYYIYHSSTVPTSPQAACLKSSWFLLKTISNGLWNNSTSDRGECWEEWNKPATCYGNLFLRDFPYTKSTWSFGWWCFMTRERYLMILMLFEASLILRLSPVGRSRVGSNQGINGARKKGGKQMEARILGMYDKYMYSSGLHRFVVVSKYILVIIFEFLA